MVPSGFGRFGQSFAVSGFQYIENSERIEEIGVYFFQLKEQFRNKNLFDIGKWLLPKFKVTG